MAPRPLNLNRSSFSELSTLADCEKKWSYRYLLRDKGEASAAMQKGSFLHEVIGQWWDDPNLTMASILDNLDVTGYPEDVVADGTWLALRYEEHYGEDRAAGKLKVIGTELYVEVPIPGTAVMAVAYLDQLVLDEQGRMWLVERKSMGNWARLDTLAVDPQLTLYIWMLRTIGVPVVGVIFDAINTYRYVPSKPSQKDLIPAITEAHPEWTKKAVQEQAKADVEAHPGVERPAADSFEVQWIDRTEDHMAEALEEMRSALQRRAVLASGGRPMRNIGRACGWCFHKEDCWDALAFPDAIEILS